MKPLWLKAVTIPVGSPLVTPTGTPHQQHADRNSSIVHLQFKVLDNHGIIKVGRVQPSLNCSSSVRIQWSQINNHTKTSFNFMRQHKTYQFSVWIVYSSHNSPTWTYLCSSSNSVKQNSLLILGIINSLKISFAEKREFPSKGTNSYIGIAWYFWKWMTPPNNTCGLLVSSAHIPVLQHRAQVAAHDDKGRQQLVRGGNIWRKAEMMYPESGTVTPKKAKTVWARMCDVILCI